MENYFLFQNQLQESALQTIYYNENENEMKKNEKCLAFCMITDSYKYIFMFAYTHSDMYCKCHIS